MILAGYFFEQSWYVVQAIIHPEKLMNEGATKSTFLFFVAIFYIGYCLYVKQHCCALLSIAFSLKIISKSIMHVLRVIGSQSSEYKLAILCGFVGFVLNFVALEFPPLAASLDFDLPKGTFFVNFLVLPVISEN